jgi:hypothetical protein
MTTSLIWAARQESEIYCDELGYRIWLVQIPCTSNSVLTCTEIRKTHSSSKYMFKPNWTNKQIELPWTATIVCSSFSKENRSNTADRNQRTLDSGLAIEAAVCVIWTATHSEYCNQQLSHSEYCNPHLPNSQDWNQQLPRTSINTISNEPNSR